MLFCTWVSGVAIVFDDPTITWVEIGAAPPAEPFDTLIPGGSVATVSIVVSGSSWRDVVTALPSESVAVNLSSRWEGYSWSGAVKDPLAVSS